MKKLKYEILFTILFMTIGIAAVTSNISIKGTTPISSNTDDFLVYFSNVNSDNNDLAYNIISETKISFHVNLTNPSETNTLTFDITNASHIYDVETSVTCNYNVDYIYVLASIRNDFIPARSSTDGFITVKLNKAYAGENEIEEEITCEIQANAVERDSITNDTVPTPLSRTYYIGEEITIGEEKFNVISQDINTITMLAQYSLGTDYKQNSENVFTGTFSKTSGWEYTPGPKEIDIQTWSSNPKTYINEYVNHLKSQTGDNTLSGDLITLRDLQKIGCTITDDYSSGTVTCINSPNISWIANGQSWWTRSAYPDEDSIVWSVYLDGRISASFLNSSYSVRPVITISKNAIPKEIIYIQINNYIYQAEKGMTWEAWINSKYNTLNFYISNNQVISNKGTVLQSNITIDSTITILSTKIKDIINSSIIYEYENSPSHMGGADD